MQLGRPNPYARARASEYAIKRAVIQIQCAEQFSDF